MGSLAQLALPYKHVPAPPFSQKDNETNGYFPGSAQVHVPLAEHHKHSQTQNCPAHLSMSRLTEEECVHIAAASSNFNPHKYMM